MASRTVQLPAPVFGELTALKIRVANSTGAIPTNGSILAFALTLANTHYDDLLAALAKSDSGDTE